MKGSWAILLLVAALLALSAAGTSVYSPTDDITVNCGASGNSTAVGDPRCWIGDVDNPKHAPRSANGDDSEIVSAAPLRGSPQVPSSTPYNSARLSLFPFSYTFHLTPGPKFIRFYFFPSDYPGQDFNRRSAVFSIEAGEYTLVKDFSSSLVANSLYDSAPFSKEFVFCVGENQVLNLTFSPSTAVPGSYAFINGIEVVSMPDELYYMKSDASPEITLVGQSSRYVIDNSDTLEMVKRVNVGGSTITPDKDTGMYRNWEMDRQYVVVRNVTTDQGVTPQNTTIQLTYSRQTPNYTAPDLVYQTARSMGSNGVENLGYNLTWSLEVDSNFYYLLRLHFCESLSEITQPTDRVFQIFIDSKIAEGRADIVDWSGKGRPVHRDYVVAMFDDQSKRMNLNIALHPYGDGVPKYSDAILNGIELFKINNTAGSLAGSNPDSTGQGIEPPTPTTEQSSSSREHTARPN